MLCRSLTPGLREGPGRAKKKSLLSCWPGPCNATFHLPYSAICLDGKQWYQFCVCKTPVARGVWSLESFIRDVPGGGPGLSALQQVLNTAMAKAFLHASNPPFRSIWNKRLPVGISSRTKRRPWSHRLTLTGSLTFFLPCWRDLLLLLPWPVLCVGLTPSCGSAPCFRNIGSQSLLTLPAAYALVGGLCAQHAAILQPCPGGGSAPSPPPSPASRSDPDDEHLSLPWLCDDPDALEVEQVAVRKARRTRWGLPGDPVSKPLWLFNNRSCVLRAAIGGAAVHQLGSESARQPVPDGSTLCLRKACAAVFALDTSR